MASVDQWATMISAGQRAGVGDEPGAQLELAVQLGLGVTPEAVGCSITEIVDGERSSTIAASSALALELDQAQDDGGTGPCRRAALTGETQRVDHMESDSRFGNFTTAAFGAVVCDAEELLMRDGLSSAGLQQARRHGCGPLGQGPPNSRRTGG